VNVGDLVFSIIFAAFIGALSGVTLLWGYGIVWLALTAPLFGSLAGLCAAILLSFQSDASEDQSLAVRQQVPRRVEVSELAPR